MTGGAEVKLEADAAMDEPQVEPAAAVDVEAQLVDRSDVPTTIFGESKHYKVHAEDDKPLFSPENDMTASRLKHHAKPALLLLLGIAMVLLATSVALQGSGAGSEAPVVATGIGTPGSSSSSGGSTLADTRAKPEHESGASSTSTGAQEAVAGELVVPQTGSLHLVIGGESTYATERLTKVLFRTSLTLARQTCPSKSHWLKEMPAPSSCFAFNLYLLKGPKTGSSTLAGITRRIGARHGLSGVPNAFRPDKLRPFPRVLASHHQPSSDLIPGEKADPTFEFGFVRDPVERCLSNFYHFSFRDGASQSDEALLEFASSRHCTNFIYNYYDMAAREAGDRQPLDLAGVSERMHESVLVLGLELDVTMGDLLYVSAKVSSSAAAAAARRHRTFAEQSHKVQRWFKDAFVANNEREIAFYLAANAVLDERIAELGADRFSRLVEVYVEHVNSSERKCAKVNSDGVQVMEDCFRSDHGCYKRCLTAYAEANDLYQPLIDMLREA